MLNGIIHNLILGFEIFEHRISEKYNHTYILEPIIYGFNSSGLKYNIVMGRILL